MSKRPLTRDDIEFTFECSVELTPNGGRTLHCGECNKQVWDVSKLTRAEFEALPESACVRLAVVDGEIEFATERPDPVARLGKVAAAGLMGLLLAGCEPSVEESAQATKPAVERRVERPIELEKPEAEIPRKISRAMLLEIHRELYGEYPSGPAAADPPPLTSNPEFSGGNYRDILQRKRNIRARRKDRRHFHTGALIVLPPQKEK